MVTRTYKCPSCDQRFRVFGMGSNDDAPPCPKCQWLESEWVPERVAIAGSHSKAMDTSQRIFEQEFGLTNFNDMQREGDVAVPLTPQQSEMAASFWARESKRQGYDPVALAMGHKITPKIRADPLGPGVIRQDLGIPKER